MASLPNRGAKFRPGILPLRHLTVVRVDIALRITRFHRIL
jgi:hypothetical protein